MRDCASVINLRLFLKNVRLECAIFEDLVLLHFTNFFNLLLFRYFSLFLFLIKSGRLTKHW